MIIARVVGNVVASQKQESHEGKKILLIQPLDLEDQPMGDVIVALDAAGAEAQRRFHGVGGSVLRQRFWIGHVGLLPRWGGEGDARANPQRPINHNCFNSINDVFAARARPSDKCMILLEYFHLGVGSSNGPEQAREPFSRAVAMPSSDRAVPRFRASPDADAGHAAPGARRVCCAGRFSAAQDHAGPRRRGRARSVRGFAAAHA